MFLKTRTESLELRLFRSLFARENLSAEEKQYYFNLEKGYEGELLFDKYLESLSNDWLIISDLFLRNNTTNFQMDSLLISHDIIYLFEIKNFEGDYYIENDKWYTKSKKEITNPMIQLERNKSLLRRLLQDMGFNISIEAYLVFVNPEFTLYNAPLDKPIIFPTQIKKFLKRLDMKKPRINSRHVKMAELLVAEHISKPPFSNVPSYKYKNVKKGLSCGSCNALVSEIKCTRLVCGHCGYTESVTSAILRAVEEFSMLFPDKRITTNDIYEWCKIIESKKRIQRVLVENFSRKGDGRKSFYERED